MFFVPLHLIGTTKTITVDLEREGRLTIRIGEASVQIITSRIDACPQAVDGNNGPTPELNVTAAAEPRSAITILIADDADLTLTIVQSPDASGTWGSTPAPRCHPLGAPKRNAHPVPYSPPAPSRVTEEGPRP